MRTREDGWTWLLAVVAIGCGADAGGSSDDGAGGVGGLAASGAGGEIVSSGGAGPAAGGSGGVSGPGAFPAVSDFEAPGAFGSATIVGTGPNGLYTVYLPAQPPPEGSGFPIVGWMSGGGTSHAAYTLLPHLASHGFVIVASDTVPGIGTEVGLGQEIIAGIDWAIVEASRAGSPLEGQLDTTKIASMGYSMGSLATFTIASDPRLTTTVHISGGNMDATRIQNLHAPAVFLCGIPGDATCDLLSAGCDIAAVNCDTDFANATTPVFYGNFPAGHLGVLQSPHMERIRGEVTAWLRWQLMSDATIAPRFAGPSCTLCSDAYWQVQQKSL